VRAAEHCQGALTADEVAHHAVERARQSSGQLARTVAMKLAHLDLVMDVLTKPDDPL
jgi:hypothetical protein